MKLLTFILVVVLNFAFTKAKSYIGKWGVYQGCSSTACCCPDKDSLVGITKGDSTGTLNMYIADGKWTSGCNDYGWKTDTMVNLPWDDSTDIDGTAGVKTTYKKIDGVTVTWTYYPLLTEASTDAEGVSKGDPIISVTVAQGTSASCSFILSSKLIAITSGILVIFFAILML